MSFNEFYQEFYGIIPHGNFTKREYHDLAFKVFSSILKKELTEEEESLKALYLNAKRYKTLVNSRLESISQRMSKVN